MIHKHNVSDIIWDYGNNNDNKKESLIKKIMKLLMPRSYEDGVESYDYFY